MEQYQASDLIRLAKRNHNTKRLYLLVNPLQGKHIPVSPSVALTMMRRLGKLTADKYPDGDLVIGFAETATAIAAVVASSLNQEVKYIQTTREPLISKRPVVEFQEEHSHATEQFLCAEGLENAIKESHRIIFVDDELSTGKTLLNIVNNLRSFYPIMNEKPIVAVSLINRISDNQLYLFSKERIECLSLIHIPLQDFTENVKKYDISIPLKCCHFGKYERIKKKIETDDPRMGVIMRDYYSSLTKAIDRYLLAIKDDIKDKIVEVIGSEEYMLPGLLLGEKMEKSNYPKSVTFHATTRSPIGLNEAPEYPIRSGYQVPSFYEDGRETYIYNMKKCDVAVIVTDSVDKKQADKAASAIAGILEADGCKKVFLIQEEYHV